MAPQSEDTTKPEGRFSYNANRSVKHKHPRVNEKADNSEIVSSAVLVMQNVLALFAAVKSDAVCSSPFMNFSLAYTQAASEQVVTDANWKDAPAIEIVGTNGLGVAPALSTSRSTSS